MRPLGGLYRHIYRWLLIGELHIAGYLGNRCGGPSGLAVVDPHVVQIAGRKLDEGEPGA